MRKLNRSDAVNSFIARIDQGDTEFVDTIINEFDNQEQLKEDSLEMLFRGLPELENDARMILVKVTCLNEFYSTRLNSNPAKSSPSRKIAVDIATMAEHISMLIENQELADLIAFGDAKAVDLIRWIPNKAAGIYSDAYSFATKYCSWHNPEAYPIVDGYSKAMVYYLFCSLFGTMLEGVRITYSALQDYETFCRLFNELKTWINNRCAPSKEYSVKDCDKLFWYYASYRAVNSGLYI